MDLVSVIMPTYKNDGKSLKKAILSVLCQTYDNLELIVINDNYDMRYTDIVRGVISNFNSDKIVYHENIENLGSAKSRNVGIEMAKGKYITFLDDDDFYMPEKIEKQYQKMVDTEADYSISNVELYSENGELKDRRSRKYLENGTLNTEELINYHLKYHMTGTDTLMFKKEYLNKIGDFPLIDLGDEFYLMFNSIKGGGKLVYCNYYGVHAVIHEGEVGLSSGRNKIKCEEDLYEFKKRYFKDLDKETVKFIKTRHYAVLAFAELRCENISGMIKHMFTAFSISPKSCFHILKDRKG